MRDRVAHGMLLCNIAGSPLAANSYLSQLAQPGLALVCATPLNPFSAIIDGTALQPRS